MKFLKRTAGAPIVMALLMLTACPQNSYQKAAQASRDFSLALQAFQSVVISARHSNPPLITADENVKLQTLIKQMAQIDDHLNAGILAASKGGNAQGDIDAALAQAQALDAENLDFIKNPNAKAELQVALVAAKGVLMTVRLALGK